MSKGIVLAGGSGTRLHPITRTITKQLLPIYDKPMIYYPISTLMLAGVKDFLIISTPKDIGSYQELLGNGKHIGVSFQYEIQKEPKGISEAFLIGKDFIGYDNVWLILGDNLFFGHNIPDMMRTTTNRKGATIFGYYVADPRRYGVVEFNTFKRVLSIEEKPIRPKSNYAVVGLYHYPNSVIEATEALEPSARGELEITDLNNEYLAIDELHVEIFGRGTAWLDTGTYDSLLEASHFVQTMQKRTGLMIGCLEEIAYSLKYITREQLALLAYSMENTSYGQYLLKLIDDNEHCVLFS